jgi:excisionase family DNA binding protein
MTDEWISQAEAARLRGVSRQAISKLVRKGRFATMRAGPYTLLRRTDVLAYNRQSAGRPRKDTSSAGGRS